MNVSLRSQMVAGVAALGATAVAITPITQSAAVPSMQRVAASVQLSALWSEFYNPLEPLLYRLDDVNYYTLNQSFPDFVWPDFFYGEQALYAPLNAGIIPDLVNQFSTGPLSGLVNNLSGYGYAVADGAITLGAGVADSVFYALPTAVTAVQELIAGDPQAALDALVTGIVEPITNGLSYAAAAAGYIVQNAIQNVRIVATEFVPYLVRELIGDSLVPGLTYMANNLVATVQTVIQDIAGGNLADAWNDATLGLVGFDGLLGNAIKLTIGPGITEVVEDVEEVTIASGRAIVTSELQRLGGQKSLGEGGISNPDFFVPSGAAAVDPAPAAASEAEAPASVAPVAAVEAPAADDLGDAPKSVEAPATDDLGDAPKAVDASKAVDSGDAVDVGPAVGSSPRAASNAKGGADSESAGPKASKRADRAGASGKHSRGAR